MNTIIPIIIPTPAPEPERCKKCGAVIERDDGPDPSAGTVAIVAGLFLVFIFGLPHLWMWWGRSWPALNDVLCFGGGRPEYWTVAFLNILAWVFAVLFAVLVFGISSSIEGDKKP